MVNKDILPGFRRDPDNTEIRQTLEIHLNPIRSGEEVRKIPLTFRAKLRNFSFSDDVASRQVARQVERFLIRAGTEGVELGDIYYPPHRIAEIHKGQIVPDVK